MLERGAFLLSTLLSACAHVEPTHASPRQFVSTHDASAPPFVPSVEVRVDAGASDVSLTSDAPPPAPPLITVRPATALDPRCPVAVDRPDLVVARVGRIRITACEVVLEWHRRTRGGLRVDDPRALLDGLVREVMLSTRAPMPLPQDAEIARALADALLRREASAAMEPVDTSDAALSRYAESHRGQFIRDARLHLRALVLPTREAALSSIEALRAGTPLSALAASAADRTVRRDLGDLGMLTAEGAGAVPAGVVTAARSLVRDGEVFPEPVEVSGPTPRSRRGRRQGAGASAWWVVERVARSADENLPEAQVRRRVGQRLLRDRYRDALRAADERLRSEVAERARAAIVPEGLSAVRVGAPR